MSVKRMVFTNSVDKVLRTNLWIQHRVSLEDLAVLLANYASFGGVKLKDGKWYAMCDVKYLDDMDPGELWKVIREMLEERGSDSYKGFNGEENEVLEWARRQVREHIPQGVMKEADANGSQAGGVPD